MAFTNIALVGATGNLGPAILNALLSDGTFNVTILTRADSTSTSTLPSHPRQTITKVDFSDPTALTASLQGIDAVIANTASHALLTQKPLITAAIAADVRRFLPSEFGSDLSVPANAAIPFQQPKIEINKYLKRQAALHPNFSYTSVTTGPFLDFCIRFGIFADVNKREVTLWDGGDTRVSTTTMASVGKAVVGVLKNPEATRNRHIRVADTTITQRQLFEMVREVDGGAAEWTVAEGRTAEALRRAMEELAKPEPDMMVAVLNQLYRVIFAKEHGLDFSERLDNELVELPLMSEEQVRDVVRACL